jgi:hypothetical protein
MKRALALVLLSALYGCGGNPPPDLCLGPKPCPEAVCQLGRWTGCPPPECDPATKPSPDCTCENGAWKCPPPPDHQPRCDAAAGKVSECWHDPGTGWVWNCKGGAPTVSDPSQCPVVVPGTPLRTDGNQFSPPILGSVTTHHGWPFVEASGVDKIAAAGLNYTAERAPGIADDRGPGFEVYERVAGTASRWAPPLSPSAVLGLLSASSPGEAEARAKLDGVFNQSPALRSVLMRGVKIPAAVPKYDLMKFSKPYQEKLRAETAHKLSKGVYVNRGLWDCWIAIHREEFPIWWVGPYNVNGVDLMKIDDFRQAPHPVILAHVREEVRVSGAYPNVIYELGNEAYRCKPTAAFVDGMREAVRSAEREFGYVKHLWSPGSRGPEDNTELGSEYDFISAHGSPRAAGVVPLEVNEFAPQKQGQYLANLCEARRLDTPAFHAWHDDNPHEGGDWESPEWEAEWLDTMAKMKSLTCGEVPVPEKRFPQGVPEEDYTRHTALPALHDEINAAKVAITGCSVGSTCYHGRTPQAFLAELAGELRKRGLWAGQHVEGNTDEIAIATSCTGQWESDHSTSFGDPAAVVWSQKPADWGSKPCAGDREHGDPPGLGCPGVGARAYRGNWSITPNHCPAQAACPAMGRFQPLSVRQQAKTLVDATPVTCDTAWCHANGFPDRQCCPAAVEGQPRPCETAWGPYTWTLDGVVCNGLPCTAGGNCFSNNNPLQYAICRSGTVSVKAESAGISATPIQVTVP